MCKPFSGDFFSLWASEHYRSHNGAKVLTSKEVKTWFARGHGPSCDYSSNLLSGQTGSIVVTAAPVATVPKPNPVRYSTIPVGNLI